MRGSEAVPKSRRSGPFSGIGLEGRSTGERIRRLRMAHRWSMGLLARELRRELRRRGEQLPPSVISLKQMISKWENDKKTPNEYNRHLLAEVLEVTVADLGLTQDPDFFW